MKNVVFLILSAILFIGGLALMGYAIQTPGWEAVMFVGGILAVALAFALPIHLLPMLD